jgi:hypothetical protein
MGFLDAITPSGRRWNRISKEATEAISRAAAHQCHAAGFPDPLSESKRLAAIYSIDGGRRTWQDFGEVAFHLMVTYPPDLAYVILYGLREVSRAGNDPVPLVLKALEEMYGFRPTCANLSPDAAGRYDDAFTRAEKRAELAAHILARELSTMPLRYASGVWTSANEKARPYIHAALVNFNPRAAQLLERSPRAWILTPVGIVRSIVELLFGRDEK